jgi:hypothetical protein
VDSTARSGSLAAGLEPSSDFPARRVALQRAPARRVALQGGVTLDGIRLERPRAVPQQVDAWRTTRRKDKVLQPDGANKSTTFPTIRMDECTLAYFRMQLQQDTIFPGVVELARHVLPCPPSTAPVERIFSVAGQVERSAKYQLTDATLAMQTILREVWDMV